jgi:hypothetical protein
VRAWRLGGLNTRRAGGRVRRYYYQNPKNAFGRILEGLWVLGNVCVPHNSCKILAIEVEEVNDNCN